MRDDVNHPTHYNSHPSGIECVTVAEHFNFNVGNAIKYLWRAGLKNLWPDDINGPIKDHIARVDAKHLEDLKKAEWYIRREIQRLEKIYGKN